MVAETTAAAPHGIGLGATPVIVTPVTPRPKLDGAVLTNNINMASKILRPVEILAVVDFFILRSCDFIFYGFRKFEFIEMGHKCMEENLK